MRAAPELAGVVVPHTASIQMHAAQNQIFGLLWHWATGRSRSTNRSNRVDTCRVPPPFLDLLLSVCSLPRGDWPATRKPDPIRSLTTSADCDAT